MLKLKHTHQRNIDIVVHLLLSSSDTGKHNCLKIQLCQKLS